MSGESVLAPASLGIVALTIAAPAAVLWGVVKIVQKIVDERVEAAKKEIEAEKTLSREWQSYKKNKPRK